jgi:hypothetical protein
MDRWEQSGLASLTGRADGEPSRAPGGLTTFLDQLQGRIGDVAGIDVYDALAIRIATHGLRRQGATSCGGKTQLVRTLDAWAALALARQADIDVLDAWLGVFGCDALDDHDRWAFVASMAATRRSDELWHQAGLLGLPFAVLGQHAPRSGVVTTVLGDHRPVRLNDALVVDLSALWAGPLCAHLLGRLGARVIKVESTVRPDGARFGPAAFYEALHDGHESRTIDFASAEGISELRDLIAEADVVITGSRPRALNGLGITAAKATNATAWVAITGYGSSASWCDRVAFGDDAAVAGGLVCIDDAGPMFCGDAIADPLSGLVAADAVVRQFATGTRAFIDVAMASVAADAAAGRYRA